MDRVLMAAHAVRGRVLAVALAACLPLGRLHAQDTQRPPAGPAAAAWSIDRLDTAMPAGDARTVLRDAAVRRAELGWMYAIPAFLHMRQRWGWLQGMRAQGIDPADAYGRFLLLREPTSPRTQDPSPNHDTLYGATFVDLSTGPVVLSVPPIPDRYWSVAMIDAWFYNFEYVGSRTTGQDGGRWLIAGPSWTGAAPPGITRVIRAPTDSVNLYQRIWFRDDADLPDVRRLQDAITVRPLVSLTDPSAQPRRADVARVLADAPYAVADPVGMLRLANRYMGENPPPASDQALVEHIAPVGIGPGATLPSDDAGLAVLRDGADLALRTLSAMAVEGSRTVNGWEVPPTDVGRRGAPDGVTRQALAQIRTIGLNVPQEAVYYATVTDGTGAPLDASKRYAMRFEKGALPPVRRDRHGFWSLTMYDRETLRLVPNAANRYVVRASDPLVFAPDGSLTLLLQRDPPADPALRANWLPAPAKVRFALNLRVYLGEAAVVTGAYAPPPVVEIR
jgi:hypothetical protein